MTALDEKAAPCPELVQASCSRMRRLYADRIVENWRPRTMVGRLRKRVRALQAKQGGQGGLF